MQFQKPSVCSFLAIAMHTWEYSINGMSDLLLFLSNDRCFLVIEMPLQVSSSGHTAGSKPYSCRLMACEDYLIDRIIEDLT